MATPDFKEGEEQWGKSIASMLLEQRLLKAAMPLDVLQRFGGGKYPKLNRLQKVRRWIYTRLFQWNDPYWPVPKLPKSNLGDTFTFRRLKPFAVPIQDILQEIEKSPPCIHKTYGNYQFFPNYLEVEDIPELVNATYEAALDWTMMDKKG